jgi:hypothetical protein
MRVRIATLSLVLLTESCDTALVNRADSASPTSPTIAFSPPTDTHCNDTGNLLGLNLSKYWQKGSNGKNYLICGAAAQVVADLHLDQTTIIQPAINIWNRVLDHGLPRFVLVPGSIVVSVQVSGYPNTYACGNTDQANHVVTIYYSSLTTNCLGGNARTVVASNSTEMSKLVAHELGHVLGFGHFVINQAVYDPANAHIRYCMMVVPPSTADPLNGSVCEHERQLIYYEYGLQPNDPSKDKDFAISLALDKSTVPLDLNQSGTVNVTQLVVSVPAGGTTAAPVGTNDFFAWSLANVSPAGAFTVDNTSDPAGIVHGTTIAGSATLRVDLGSTGNYNMGWPFVVGQAAVTTRAPDGPPSNLGVSNVTATTAQLSWTTGDATATTTVQDRQTAVGGSWLTAGTAGPSVTTFSLTGLSACTPYDVQLTHYRNGKPSVLYTVVSAFGTAATSGACTPVNFHIVQCHADGNNEYYNLGWTQTEFSSGSTYEIGQATTNNSANAAVISGGSSATTATSIGPYDRRKTFTTYYFWVRQKLANGTPGAWAALYDNPVKPSQGC